MRGPIFVEGDAGKSDVEVHRPLIDAVDFPQSKTAPLTLDKLIKIGISEEVAKRLLEL